MQKLGLYGKGGIGKSTVAQNLSVALATDNNKVLHVGCDPKHDSTLPLTEGEVPVTIAERLITGRDHIAEADEFVVTGRYGIDLVEAGGPEPGIGCAGRGIARMFDIFEDVDIVGRGYDWALFDVLGDVVCGGFAAPMRQGWANRIVIVTSEEIMALYAANNIARAIDRFERTGARLAGLVVNRRDNNATLALVHAFAKEIGAPILATIPREPKIRFAEQQGKTIVEYDSDCEASQRFKQLADDLKSLTDDKLVLPTPMTDAGFRDFVQQFDGAKE